MRQSTVTFAMRDFDRLKCIQAVIDGELKPIRAAERLGLTTGLSKDQGEFVLARISSIARTAGVPLDSQKCNANLLVIVTIQPDRQVKTCVRVDPTRFADAHGSQALKRNQRTDGNDPLRIRPIVVMHNRGIHEGAYFSLQLRMLALRRDGYFVERVRAFLRRWRRRCRGAGANEHGKQRQTTRWEAINHGP